MNWRFFPKTLAVLNILALIPCISVLLCCNVAMADNGTPKRLANVQPGDCAACHAGGKQVLPSGHIATKTMNLQQCLMCHKKDKTPIKDKLPTSHTHMLSGISCQNCHGGKESFSKGGLKACIACHSIDTLAKAPAKDEKKIPNPHNYNSHRGTDAGCSDCHRQHAKSIFFCSECHNFTNITPSPMTELVFNSKITGEKVPAKAPQVESGASRPVALAPAEPPDTVQQVADSKIWKSASGAPASAPGAAMECSTCHSGPKYQQHFIQTSHGALSCTTCHLAIQDFTSHTQRKEKSKLLSCAVCHRNIEKQYEKSSHALEAKISCLQCHTDIHPEKALPAKKGKADSVQTCLRCHSDENKYLKKGHTAKALAGNADAAVCSDCHGIHGTPVFAATDKGIADKRIYYTQLCISCHRKGGVAGRYGVFPMVVSTYGETYHGKVMKLGYPEKVAGCADCHIGHNILPAGDSASALNPDQLVKTCGKCHHGFHPRFVSYVPHPVPDDRHRFLGLHLTKDLMISLLVGVFAFFWIHSLLWWRKVYAEKSRLCREGLQVKAELPEEEGSQYVRRFGVQERIMHVVLICSFFGVVVSGFPLKYSDAWGSKVFVSLFGGIENAGNIHRISAAFMVILFLYTCWLSLKFLFPGFRFKGWADRLFGPDSLFLRIKDFQDCWRMFKWFFNAGERPKFDRWTYWEKFDFMAVFWGMFVIGLSGVVMWVPEWASYVMPGWMINIFHLAHSAEAFLAAVFIFTIHFFNNHLVPDKFPMERNIFTGSYTVEALKKERPLEYERILDENRIEEIKCKGPGTGIQLFAGVFGIASVLLGLALTALIFWAMFMK